METRPCVSVLMPVFNGAGYLDEAIQSILRQTFSEFEFIIVDDGSTDGTAAILDRYRSNDCRIHISQQSHQGLVAALNHGLRLARGRYIARMDQDDVSLPNRLSSQIAFMDSRPAVGICGTWIQTSGADRPEIRRYPSKDEMIRSWLLFESVLAHPSVMMRRDVLDHHALMYDPRAFCAEDYDLWVRAAQHTLLGNVPEVLLRYRVHAHQMVNTYGAQKRATAQGIRLRQLHRLGLDPNDSEMTLHEALSQWKMVPSKDFIIDAHAWLIKLMTANQTTGIYPSEAFQRALACRWDAVCAAATHLGLWTWNTFTRSRLWADSGLSWKEHLKFGIKCGIRRKQYA
jgi:glycosyltransferase involved in cell wall biosynthesis